MDKKTVTLAVLKSHNELNILKSILESHDIYYHVDDEYITAMNPLYSGATGDAKLQILEEDLDRVIAILEEHGIEFNYAEKPVKKTDMKKLIKPAVFTGILVIAALVYVLVQGQPEREYQSLKRAYESAFEELAKNNELATEKHLNLIFKAKDFYQKHEGNNGVYFLFLGQRQDLKNDDKTETEVYGIVLAEYALSAEKEYPNTRCTGYDDMKLALQILKKTRSSKHEEYSQYFKQDKKCEDTNADRKNLFHRD